MMAESDDEWHMDMNGRDSEPPRYCFMSSLLSCSPRSNRASNAAPAACTPTGTFAAAIGLEMILRNELEGESRDPIAAIRGTLNICTYIRISRMCVHRLASELIECLRGVTINNSKDKQLKPKMNLLLNEAAEDNYVDVHRGMDGLVMSQKKDA
jgi:hypothetical protein